MSPILSPDTEAVLRAAEALTTQVRRIADALETPVVRYEVATDDDATTPVYCPLCPDVRPLATPVDAVAHFRSHHPEQRLVGTGPWPKLATDDGPAEQCLARWHPSGPTNQLPTACIRPARHVEDHANGSGFHWADAVAIYPAESPFVTPEQAPAADEGAQRADRRASLRNLLARLERGAMLGEEKALLRQHVEAEMREVDTARAVAAGNKRHVQIMYTDLQEAQSRARQAEELLSVAHETSNQSEAARAEAQAAIERVRVMTVGIAQATAAGISDYDIGRHELAVEVYTALDGTEQPGRIPEQRTDGDA